MTESDPKHGTLEPVPLETATFQGRLRWLRRARELKQAQLAQALGCDQTIVSSWEIGRSRPSAATLKALLRFYGISQEALETGEGFEAEAQAALEAFRKGGQAPASSLPVTLTLEPSKPGQVAALDLPLGTTLSKDLPQAMTLLAQAVAEGREVWMVIR